MKKGNVMVRSDKNRDRRYLIVAADDFGRSSSVNMAVAEAHDRGIVTASSVMAGGEAFEEAVQIALKRSRLSVGLHVTLCDGRAVLKQSQIPDLVDRDGCFEASPARAWVGYMRRAVLSQIEAEVEAQFDRLDKAGYSSDPCRRSPSPPDAPSHIQDTLQAGFKERNRLDPDALRAPVARSQLAFLIARDYAVPGEGCFWSTEGL